MEPTEPELRRRLVRTERAAGLHGDGAPHGGLCVPMSPLDCCACGCDDPRRFATCGVIWPEALMNGPFMRTLAEIGGAASKAK